MNMNSVLLLKVRQAAMLPSGIGALLHVLLLLLILILVVITVRIVLAESY